MQRSELLATGNTACLGPQADVLASYATHVSIRTIGVQRALNFRPRGAVTTTNAQRTLAPCDVRQIFVGDYVQQTVADISNALLPGPMEEA